jgi:lysine 6-dehydrogenase
MRILVLGAGLQGAACAFDLLNTSDAVVTLADARMTALPGFLADAPRDRLAHIQLDARDEFSMAAAMSAHDVALSALPYYFNYDALRSAIEAGTHFADLGGNTEIVDRQLSLADRAREEGVGAVVDCGLAPGMVNVLAMDLVQRMDQVESVKLYVGGLPQHPEPPLNYQIVYSLEGTLDYYTTKAWILQDGEPKRVEALSGVEEIDFPEPIGQLEAFHTGGGLSTMPWDLAGKIKSMEYKTLRYPGHVAYMKPIRALGLLSLQPVDAKGVSVVPRDLFVALADTALRKPDGRDLVVLLVQATGQKGGQSITASYRLIDRYDETNSVSAMMRTTGYSLSITGQMLAHGKIKTGVHTAYQVTPADQFIEELAHRGINAERTTSNV